MHPDTVCHTHDLLDCRCSAVGGAVEHEAEDDEESSGEEEAEMNGFTVASQIKPEKLSKMDKAVRNMCQPTSAFDSSVI